MTVFSDLHPRRFFIGTWQHIEQQAQEERAQRSRYDFRPCLVFLWAAVCLTLIEYLGNVPAFEAFIQWTHLQRVHSWRYYELAIYGWWTFWRILGYFILPAVFTWVVLRESIRDYGLRLKGVWQHAWMYVVFFIIVLICITCVSRQEAFLIYYPFYSRAQESWFDLLAWETMYIAQFFALEFFFRGFLLMPCRAAMGSSAIFAMTIPYTMIHYDKPLLEVFAAIVAGIVLGTLAMRTRSIVNGFFIHAAVAVSMDLSSILHRGGLPRVFFQ